MKIENFKLKIFLNIILTISLLFLPQNAVAKEFSLKIQPSALQIRSSAPADIRFPFSISNLGTESINLKAIFKRLEAGANENGQLTYSKPAIADERPKDSFLQNVTITDDGFTTDSLILSPKQEKTLELVINVPKNSAPEDHYFSIIFLTEADKKNPDSQTPEKETLSYVQAGISLPILLSIGSNKHEPSIIEEFSTSIFLESGPVPITLKVANTGTHFISLKAVVTITNMFGQTVGRVDIPTTNILAGSSRYLTNDTKPSLTSQSLVPKIVWEEKFLLGFYTISLSLADHNNKLLYTRTLHFFAFPFIFLSGIIVSIVLITIIIKRIKKRLSQI